MQDRLQDKLPNWLKEISWSWTFVILLAVVLWGGSMILAVYNDSEKARLTKNNLMLVKDNRELRAENKKLAVLEQCLRSSGFQLSPKD
ncbi:MAG: hypothetical protein U7127_31475 (plasmid) [Phormidium sp.]